MTMIQLNRPPQFKQVRYFEGTPAADPADLTNAVYSEAAAVENRERCQQLQVVWDADNAVSTDEVEIQALIRDGGPNLWREGWTITNIKPGVVVVFNVYGASTVFFRLKSLSVGGTVANLSIRAARV